MLKNIAIITAISSFSAPPVSAEEWLHSPSIKDSASGYIEVQDGRYGISYDCHEGATVVNLFAKDPGPTKGVNILYVDGIMVFREDTSGYSTFQNVATTGMRGGSKFGPESIVRVNSLVAALAAGNEATWLTPSGKSLTIPLHKSAQIKNCLI